MRFEEGIRIYVIQEVVRWLSIRKHAIAVEKPRRSTAGRRKGLEHVMEGDDGKVHLPTNGLLGHVVLVH